MDDGGSEHEDEIRARIKKELVEEQQHLQELIDTAEALLKEKKEGK